MKDQKSVQIDLIRHAESELNQAGIYIGGRSNNTPLTPLGESQARKLGQYQKNRGIHYDAIWSSTARRTQHTAQLVGEYLGYTAKQIHLSEKLLELDQGDWEGKLRTDVYTKKVLSVIRANNWTFAAPKGESQRDVENRMLDTILTQVVPTISDGKRGAVFTHGFAIKCLLRNLLNFDARETFYKVIDNTSITTLTYRQGRLSVDSINTLDHLS